MKKCDLFKERLLLLQYDELNPAEKAELEAHLQVCPNCRKEMQQFTALHQQIPAQPLVEPSEEILQTFRNDLYYKIRAAARAKSENSKRAFSFIYPKPVFQFGFMAVILLLGFFLGRITLTPAPPKSEISVMDVLSLNQPVEFPNGELNPFLGAVQRVKYNAETGDVEIFYNTINDVRLQGDLQNPVVQQILKQALLEENNAAVRLHAIKAVSAMTTTGAVLTPALQDVLINLLNDEENEGIRLQTLRILEKITLTEDLKNMLVRVLLFDSNPAIRIEAFQILTKQKLRSEDINNFILVAQRDTNEFIRFQAKQMLNQMRKRVPEHQNETSTIAIERKE